MSNDAVATTLGPPDIAVAPDSLFADLLTGATASRIVTISNSGASELVFTVEREALDAARRIDVLTAHDGVPDRVIASGRSVPLATLQGIPRLKTVAPGEYAKPDKDGVMRPLDTGPGRQVLGHNEEVFGNTQNAFYGGRACAEHLPVHDRAPAARAPLLPAGRLPDDDVFLVYEGLASSGRSISSARPTSRRRGPASAGTARGRSTSSWSRAATT